MRQKAIGMILAALFCLASNSPSTEVLKLAEIRWDFEKGDLQGWSQTGNLAKHPTNKSDDRHMGNFNKQGRYFIGTCELTTPGTAYNDDLTGELKSPQFLIDQPAVSLLVGGGSSENVCVALCDAKTGEQLVFARGGDAEAMRRIIWDLSKLQGRTAFFKIVDSAKGGWGHINVDDIHPVTKEEIEAARRAEEEKREAAKRKIARLLENAFQSERKVYSGKELHALGMPLGPIGGGSMYLRGTGELYRWEIFNNMNSAAYIPDQFFAIRAKPAGGEAVTRVLRYYDGKEPGVKDIRFVGEFPIAYLEYVEPALPVKVSMTAFSPFIPTNAQDSAIPVIFFSITVNNESQEKVAVSLIGALQNAVGYDGKSRYEGASWEGYGGNANYLFPGGENAYLVFMAKEGSRANMGFAMGGKGAIANPQWADARSLLDDFARTGSLGASASGPSEKGTTWNAALGSAFELAPGERTDVGFAILWYFPGRLGVGNMYENWFTSGIDIATRLLNAGRLSEDTVLFHDTLFDTTLPYYVVERLSSQMSSPCTQLCMWLKDNSFFGFEGLNADGTGCCPMNCNHVWNYEQTLARLFPEIERRMRVIDLEHQMEDNGAVHHRVEYPLKGRVTGPGAVCDGQASTISKTYREHLMSADDSFLKQMWPKAKKAMDFMIAFWDGPDEDGVMRGKQFNTYDTSISGPNTFTGTQYLAALRAAEEMAKEMGEEEAAKRYRSIFEKGSKWVGEHLFNGEYFVQEWPQANPDHDYGLGCHADQLMGQWWASQLDLACVLPRHQVRSSLQFIFKYDFIPDFSAFEYSLGHRTFVWDAGAGLICCTWPRGGKPKTIILYAEEVWTGIEYEVAAMMINEGMINEALAIVRTVHDRYTNGTRNPWNEIECGDHYARAMSSWSVLLAAQGFKYHGPKGIVGFAPKLQEKNFRSFFSTAEGWGSFSQKRGGNTQTNLIELKYGALRLKQLELEVPSASLRDVKLELSGKDFPFDRKISDSRLVITFPGPLNLKPGSSIKVTAGW